MEHAVYQHFVGCGFVFVIPFHNTFGAFYQYFAVARKRDFVVGTRRHRKRIFARAYGNAA